MKCLISNNNLIKCSIIPQKKKLFLFLMCSEYIIISASVPDLRGKMPEKALLEDRRH